MPVVHGGNASETTIGLPVAAVWGEMACEHDVVRFSFQRRRVRKHRSKSEDSHHFGSKVCRYYFDPPVVGLLCLCAEVCCAVAPPVYMQNNRRENRTQTKSDPFYLSPIAGALKEFEPPKITIRFKKSSKFFLS